MRELRMDEVEFDVECHPEESDYRNHCSHEGCEKCHRWIRDQLRAGNEWAWCSVRVVGRWNGLKEGKWLGCCSYKSKADFMRPGNYYEDMKQEVLDRLNAKIQELAAKLAPLIEG